MPSGPPVSVTLQDTGTGKKRNTLQIMLHSLNLSFLLFLGGDVRAGDGLYSAFFLDFTPSSEQLRYGLSVSCRGGAQSTVNLNSVVGKSSRINNNNFNFF